MRHASGATPAIHFTAISPANPMTMRALRSTVWLLASLLFGACASAVDAPAVPDATLLTDVSPPVETPASPSPRA
jgi:hypothetical protein